MPCDTADLPGGVTAIVCSRGRSSKPCAYCGRASTRLCDFPVLKKIRSTGLETKGTCDVPLCDRCTSKIAGDGDLCRAHVPLWDAQLGKPKVGPGAETP